MIYDAGTTTPNLAGLVEIPAFTIDGDPFRLNDGTFELHGAPGLLWGSPGMGVGVSALSNDHGGYAGLPLYGPREFSLVGEIAVAALADLWDAIDLLFEAFNLADTSLKTLTLNTSGWAATRQVDARLAGDIRIVEPSDKNGHLARRRQFMVPMIAPDPRIYSTTLQTVTVDASEALTNAGNFPTPFRVRFNGSQTNPKVDGPGGGTTNRIRYGAVVTSGHWVEYQSNRNAAGGVSALDDAGANAWPDISNRTASVIAPGTSTWSASNDAGAGTTVMYFRDAWI